MTKYAKIVWVDNIVKLKMSYINCLRRPKKAKISKIEAAGQLNQHNTSDKQHHNHSQNSKGDNLDENRMIFNDERQIIFEPIRTVPGTHTHVCCLLKR